MTWQAWNRGGMHNISITWRFRVPHGVGNDRLHHRWVCGSSTHDQRAALQQKLGQLLHLVSCEINKRHGSQGVRGVSKMIVYIYLPAETWPHDCEPHYIKPTAILDVDDSTLF